MNIKYTKIICTILIVATLFSLTGCGGTDDVWSEWVEVVEVPDDNSELVSSDQTDDFDDTNHKDGQSSKQNPIQTGDIKITENGKSRYSIVVSISNDGYDQGRLIQKVIKLTTGVSVPLILDSETSDGPEIIVGNTSRNQTVSALNSIGNNEYIIKADSNRNIIIAAKKEYVIQLAAKKFLELYFGYNDNATTVGKEKAIPKNVLIRQDLLSDYKMVWSDEFNGKILDTNKWCFKGHMSEQPHLKLFSDSRAVNVNNGCLNLSSGRIDDDNYFATMPVSTADTFVFKYGYLEIKAKVPFGRPAFPAFWMQSSTRDAVCYNVMSEIDIFEMFGVDNSIESTLHKWYRDGGGHFSGGYDKGSLPKYTFKDKATAEQWHTYALLWTPTTLNYMVDGEIYGTVDITDVGDFGDHNDGMGCFHDYHHIILNNYLYTEGSSISNQNKDAKPTDNFPITFSIDYIRLYQLPGQGGVIDLNN